MSEQPASPTRRRARFPTGVDLLHDPTLNKGTAFSEEERTKLGLKGLLPPRSLTQEQQVQKALDNFHRESSDIAKYLYLMSLQDRNERLFYRVVIDHLQDMMPIVYTPTVGQACQLYGHLWQRPRGLFISAQDRGSVARVMRNWPRGPVRAIVVTDGERILGLGDLGANGMGIPVGKLSLYTACAGIDPAWCLPVTLDVGTNNDALLGDPLYSGLPHHRLPREEYDSLIDEFMEGVAQVFPRALVQFEDFASANAFRLLEKYRHSACCFNDDIQGTAAMCLAGLDSAIRLLPVPELGAQTILFQGAGEAGIGIADLLVAALMADGVSESAAKDRCWFVDSKGLVVTSRGDLSEQKRAYAHDHEAAPDLLSAVKLLKPTALIGVSGQPHTFTRPVIETMAAANEKPVIFALSNPTSKSECTAEEAYAWSGGRAIFASGSPFAPVAYGGRTIVPGQANNAYIFPGLALGVIASGARHVTDAMFLEAARALSAAVGHSDLAQGRIFPPLERIREISRSIATVVAARAYDAGLATTPRPNDIGAFIDGQMYEPRYATYV
ncbi:MAG: NAD-dependent malic enzyme [Acidobacteria bacterium]|nr:NAD-dependent malic enzyme [Acidobacteriota bacterium]